MKNIKLNPLHPNEYQKVAHEFAFYDSPVFVRKSGEYESHILCGYCYPALALAEEAGEVTGKFAKIIRDKKGVITSEDVDAIAKELGDVCWQLAEICTVLGLNLEDVMRGNIEKLTDRANRGKLSGSGDNR